MLIILDHIGDIELMLRLQCHSLDTYKCLS